MKRTNEITEANLELARNYLQQQFESRSWWPRAEPGLAKHEFELMNDSPGALAVWCNRWLDAGQIRKLKRKI